MSRMALCKCNASFTLTSGSPGIQQVAHGVLEVFIREINGQVMGAWQKYCKGTSTFAVTGAKNQQAEGS